MGIKDTAVKIGVGALKEVVHIPGHIVGTTWMKWAAQACDHGYQNVIRSITIDMKQVDGDEFAARKAHFQKELAAASKDDYKAQMRAWQISSRFFYLFSFLLLLVVALIMSTTLGGAWTLLDGAALAALLFSKGLRHSYRYWQMKTGTFFVKGAFKRWWQQGVWLV